jgi:carbamoyltransferase
MKILGINIASHDTSAALIVDGKLICAFEEERFNKKKHTHAFPINAIKECLKVSKIDFVTLMSAAESIT